jgi:DNA-binding transcriptional regulator YdaS (Cro superfamily)
VPVTNKSLADMVDVLNAECRRVGGQKACAKEHGVSPQFINDVIHGRREMTERLALSLGYRRVVTFEEVPK